MIVVKNKNGGFALIVFNDMSSISSIQILLNEILSHHLMNKIS